MNLNFSSQLINKAEDIALHQNALKHITADKALLLNTLRLADAKARYAQLATSQLTDMLHLMLLEYETSITPALEETAIITDSLRIRLRRLRQKMAAVVRLTNNLSAKAGKLHIELTTLLKQHPDSLAAKLPALTDVSKEYRVRGDQLFDDAEALLQQAAMTLDSIATTSANL
jgi:hypothetical protein